MSGAATRIPLAEAQALAAEVVEMLATSCERIEVAGSIRRKRPDIGDIELVAVPKLRPVKETDLFGEVVKESVADLLHAKVARLLFDGLFEPRLDKNGRSAVGGERYKRLRYRGVSLDLFAVKAPAQWGVVFLIRTGPADWSHRLVTPCERHAFSADGRDLGPGWMPPGFYVKDGALWRDGVLVETPEERDVFRAIELEWLEPEARR